MFESAAQDRRGLGHVDRGDGHLLQATLDAMDQGIVMVDADLRISVINERVRHVLGLPEHLARTGVHFADILRFQEESGEFGSVVDGDRACLPIWSIEASARSYVRHRPNGTVLEIRTAPLAGGGFVRTYSDISERHRREIALVESEQRFRLLAENTSDTIVLCDASMRRRYVSPSVTALLGYRPDELLGSRPEDAVHPDDAAGYAREIADLVADSTGRARTRKRYRHKRGGFVWVDLTVSCVATPSGDIDGYVAVLRDATTQVDGENRLRLNQQRLAFALESGGDGVWSYDCLRDHVVLEGRWWAVLGYAQSEVAPTFAGWHDLTHPDDQQHVREVMVDHLKVMVDHLKGNSDAIRVEYRIRSRSGAYVWTLARGRIAERSADGKATLIIGTHQDITLRKTEEQAIARLALHDVLTGLPNRGFFRGLLEEVIQTARSKSTRYALLACDLDRFKSVNDTFGHAAGDKVLRVIAERLLSAVRIGDTVARVGGDEFVVLLADLVAEQDASDAAQRIVAAIEEPLDFEDRRVQIGISVGIAHGRTGGDTVDDLCHRADVAMYVAKASGRNSFSVHQPHKACSAAVRDAVVSGQDPSNGQSGAITAAA